VRRSRKFNRSGTGEARPADTLSNHPTEAISTGSKPQAVRRAKEMIVLKDGRIPWRRLLGSLLGALLVAMAGSIALMANKGDPGPIQIAIEIIALPVVCIVHLVGGLRGAQPIWFAVLSSILMWWAILFALLTRRARRRTPHQSGLTRGCRGLAADEPENGKRHACL
jgi:hypothetical protein